MCPHSHNCALILVLDSKLSVPLSPPPSSSTKVNFLQLHAKESLLQSLPLSSSSSSLCSSESLSVQKETMGSSWSSKRRNDNFHQNPSPQIISSSYSSHPIPPSPPPPPPSSSSSSFSFQTPLPPPTLDHPPPPPPSSQPISSFPSNPSSSIPSSSNPHQSYVVPPKPPYPSPSPPYPVQNQNHYPPPPPPNPYYYQYSGGYNTYGNSGQYNNNNPYYANNNQNNWWRPPMLLPQPPPPPPPLPLYVEYQNAKKVRNDINVHKDTIKIEVDEKNPDCNLVSFTFDAVVDGSITIFYFAKKGSDCRYTPLYPDTYTPVTVPFLKGVGQKFCQPPGTGSDLGFFDLDELSKPSPNEDVFPLVIFAEACKIPLPLDEQPDQPLPTTSNAQITEAVLVKTSEGPFKVKVIKQILLIEGVSYELRELYGIANSAEPDFNDEDPGKECVICMSEPKDTAVLPCRHMCLCSDCAKELRLQTNKCPICRQPIEELIGIKVNRGDQ